MTSETPGRSPQVEPFVVGRSALRTWLASLAAIPAIVVGVDVVWRRRIVGWLTERIFTGDPQALELRDTIWAWTLIAVGGVVVLWGIKELFSPAPIIRTSELGVKVRMLGPFREQSFIPWDRLHDVSAGSIRDDGEPVEVLVIEVTDPDLLPTDPWGGRRIDETTVALFANEWDQTPGTAAHEIAERALVYARTDEELA